jgi:hypothetical protein
MVIHALAQGAEPAVLSWPLLLALAPAAILGTASGTALLKRWNDDAFLRWSRILVRGLGLLAMGSGAVILLTA